MIEHGVCAATSSGLYKCRVFPFLERSFNFFAGFSESGGGAMKPDREL